MAVVILTEEEVLKSVEEHIKAIQSLLGIKATESTKDTPRRVAKMYCNELFSTRNNRGIKELVDSIKVFPNENAGYPFPIKVEGITFNSVCEHHWLPFFGTVDVEYVPNGKIIGLSKIPRVVKYFSKRPQLQERFTSDVGNFLFNVLFPAYIKVTVHATHTCVMCRGIESTGETVTVFERKGD